MGANSSRTLTEAERQRLAETERNTAYNRGFGGGGRGGMAGELDFSPGSSMEESDGEVEEEKGRRTRRRAAEVVGGLREAVGVSFNNIVTVRRYYSAAQEEVEADAEEVDHPPEEDEDDAMSSASAGSAGSGSAGRGGSAGSDGEGSDSNFELWRDWRLC